MKLLPARLGALSVALVAALGLWLVAGSAAFAETPRVTEFELRPPSHLTVGDRIGVSIAVEADRGTRLQIAPGGIPDGLAVAESPKFSSRTLSNGRVETRIEFAVAAFVVGDVPLPPIKLRYQDSSGTVGELQTPSSRLLVESTLPATGTLEPRDLKPQAEIGAPPRPPYEFIAAAAVLLAVAFSLLAIAWRRMSRRALTSASVEEAEPALTAEDRARAALDAAAARFASDGDTADCYAALSATVREYLTQRFGFPAFALTTVELQGQMVFRGMDRWQARLVSGLLEQCDAVMFAHYLPAGERTDADITAAYEIVEMSRPQEPEEAASA